MKQTYLTIILLDYKFAERAAEVSVGRLHVPPFSSSLTQTRGTHSPHAANEHICVPCDCWRGWLPSTLMPAADGCLAGGEIQGNFMQQVCSVNLEPAGSFLLQKLYIIWAQEQRHEEDEAVWSRGLLPWKLEFFFLHLSSSWTRGKSLPGSLPQGGFYTSGLTHKALTTAAGSCDQN